MASFLRTILIPGVFAILAYMSQVGPEDAVSNLYKWASWVITPPDWLKAPVLDNIWTIVFLLFAALVLVPYFWPRRTTVPPEQDLERMEVERHRGVVTPQGIKFGSPELLRDGDVTSVRIQVQNIGNELLQKCLVRAERIDPLPTDWKQTDLPFVIPTDHQVSQYRTRNRFHLDHDLPKYLTLARHAAGNQRNPISIITEEGVKQIPILLPLATVAYTIEIRAAAEKGGGDIKIIVLRLNAKNELSIS